MSLACSLLCYLDPGTLRCLWPQSYKPSITCVCMSVISLPRLPLHIFSLDRPLSWQFGFVDRHFSLYLDFEPKLQTFPHICIGRHLKVRLASCQHKERLVKEQSLGSIDCHTLEWCFSNDSSGATYKKIIWSDSLTCKFPVTTSILLNTISGGGAQDF